MQGWKLTIKLIWFGIRVTFEPIPLPETSVVKPEPPKQDAIVKPTTSQIEAEVTKEVLASETTPESALAFVNHLGERAKAMEEENEIEQDQRSRVKRLESSK